MANRIFPYRKTTAPTVDNDTTEGYKVGDIWLDTANDRIYQVIDVSDGAAIWIEMVGVTQTQTLTNKTLTTPTIASFANAPHTHANAAGGGIIHPLAPGLMWNGKLSVTVSSDDLILAIKTLAGSDPSASDPVYVNINGTVRSITAATSCTLADGTNWMNLGAAEFATLEQDLFAYAVWDSNSSVVAVAPARIPYGRLVSDFSATTTNEKHLGNYANYTSTDDVVAIGRFAATLSAGAGYTWTVPTFTGANLMHRPVYESRWRPWVPQFTNLTVGDGTLTARYRITNQTVQYLWSLVFGSTTSVSGSVSHTLTFTRESTFSGTIVPAGIVRISDTGTAVYAGVSNFNGAASANIVAQGVGGSFATQTVLSSTVPHTWASTDEIQTSLIEFPIA